MLALNHAVFGGIIAVTLQKPELIIPTAIIAHFAMDVMPHFGNSESFGTYSRKYYRVIAVDTAITLLLATSMSVVWPSSAAIILLGGICACLPDFLWPLAPKVDKKSLLGKFFRFHKRIQISETPQGILSELAWFSFFSAGLIDLYVYR